MKALLKSTDSKQLQQFIVGMLILALMTYLAYGIAAGLQNRLSQNPLLIAILFGLFISNVFAVPKSMKPALDFSCAYFIKTGVVLIGLKISAQVIVSVGYEPVIVATAELLSIFFISYLLLNKVLNYERDFSLLLAAGCAICGAAAVIAAASVIKGNNRLVTLAITLVTLMGTLQLFAYPLLYQEGYFPQFNDRLFGIFAGASIYEFAQVYGAGYAISDTAINYGTLVKLIKVLMLVPMIFLIGYFYNKKNVSAKKINVPWFVLFFIVVVVLNSIFTINETARFLLTQLGSFLFLMAMVALGLKANVRSLFKGHDIRKIVLASLLIISLTTLISYYYTYWSSLNINIIDEDFDISLLEPTSAGGGYYGGKQIFNAIGCEKCHVESLATRNGDPLLLYSDLLIHDMGPALDDKITQGDAIGTDWRTTPLTGIGSRNRFLHDGRAFSYRDAIIAHGGEAKIVRDRFVDLDDDEKTEVYSFLDSLK